MKIPARLMSLGAIVALFFALTFAATAQDKPAPAPADQPAAAPASETAPATPPADQHPATEPSPEAAPATPPAETPKSELRQLDTPPPVPEAKAEDSADKTDGKVSGTETEAAPDAPAPAKPEKDFKRKHRPRGPSFDRHNQNERVSFWHDSTLAEGEHADAVVSVFGSSTSAGTVGDAVVSVFGSSTTSGDVGNAVISVFGNSRATSGTVGDSVVSVLGTTYVNAKVNGEVVAVLGDLELGPEAEVGGDVVCVGGTVNRDPNSVVHGQINNVAFGAHFGGFGWLQAWLTQCLFHLRPLAFGPHLMWAWWIAIGFLALYVAIAALFPRGVEKCVETLEERPGYSILTAFLATLLAPIVTILLVITIIGAPALILFLFAAGIFGKAVMLAWLGGCILKRFRGGARTIPALAVLVGGVIVLLLYTVPVVGFIVAKLMSWIGLGVVVYTLLLAMKRNKAAARAAVPPALPPVTPVMPASATPSAEVSGIAVDPFSGAAMIAPDPSGAPPVTPLPPAAPAAAPAVPPMVVSAATLPRAGFFIRLAASVLDTLIVALVTHPVPDKYRPGFLLSFAVYCLVFWALKATTVGGIVCGLKVVRLDDRPIDWVTALVRTLGGFLSLFAAGLGFIWVAFDDQKQSWHDKIAGTTVVVVPKGVSLV